MKTSNSNRYMNDSDIINEPMPLREIHAIRLKISDEIKNLKVDERRAYYTAGLDEIRQQYNIRIIPSAKRT